jgi:hypothetical protein
MDLSSENEKRLEELKKKFSKITEESDLTESPQKTINSVQQDEEDTGELENPPKKLKSDIITSQGPKILGRIDLTAFDRKPERNRIIDNQKNESTIKRYINDLKFEPIQAIGKLKFFDYKVNKFGIIIEVRNDKNIQAGEVRFSESDLNAKSRISDGDILTFTLNKSNRGFYATNVKPIKDITLKDLEKLNYFVGIKELERVIYNSVGSNYQLLDDQDRSIINKNLIKEKNPESWVLFIKLEPDEFQIENYISETIAKLTDEEKIVFLQKNQNFKLLEHILVNWKSTEKKLILLLSELVRSNQVNDEKVSIEFINCISLNEWTFEESLKLYSIFKIEIIKDLIISNFSFKKYNSIDLLKNILPVAKLTHQITSNLTSNLLLEISDISIQRIVEIFTELKQYKIIDDNHLLELMTDRKLGQDELISLISVLPANVNLNIFRKVISQSIDNFDSWELIKILELCNKKTKLAKVALDEFYSKETNNSSPNFYGLINFLKEKENLTLLKHFIDISYKSLSIPEPLIILELSIISNHLEAQKLSYKNIKFKSENEIIIFLEKIQGLKIPIEIESYNKPLSGFIEFLKSTENFELKNDCQSFLNINKGIVQCLAIKFLTYQVYKKKLSKSKLIEIINSFQWSEISALLIKGFIEESDFTEKIFLEKLNIIYKAHFDVLNIQNFDKKAFLDNFIIRDILSLCDGRKYYNGRHWQGGDVSRWYFDGKVVIETNKKDKMKCFCEGRPWKKEYVWDSNANKQTNKQIEFYWCKTSYCASRNDVVNLDQPYQSWNIFEISSVLNITIEKIALAHLAGWANRMNQIIAHLFCRECGSVLRPLPYRPQILGYYAVPLFHCINPNCSEKKTIRLTHCLNGKCESHWNSEPLDSRDCKSCRPSDPNHTGLICNVCGSSCPTCSGNNHHIIVQERW